MNLFFTGNAPSVDLSVFFGSGNPTAYYLPGTAGWAPFATETGLTTALWTLPYPLILTNGPAFGAQSNVFGFIVSWATNLTVVVEASTSLANPVWEPLQATNLADTPNGGWFEFHDPQWTNYPARFYRISKQ